MKKLQTVLVFSLLAASSIVHSEDATRLALDKRHNLNLTASERAEFLSEMRSMLGSVQGVIQGISTEDREAIAKFARISGNQMARATPASVRAKLPPSFQVLGEPTHLAFEELAIRAQTDDMDMLAKHLAKTMNYCMACHAAFKVK